MKFRWEPKPRGNDVCDFCTVDLAKWELVCANTDDGEGQLDFGSWVVCPECKVGLSHIEDI